MGNQANPQRALQGRYSCRAQGASPGLGIDTHLLSPRGAALSQRMQSHKPQRHKTNARAESAAPTELNLLLSVFTQGFISGSALIAPWALKKYRP